MADEDFEKLRQLQIAVWIGDYKTVEKLIIKEKVDVNGGGAFHVPMCLAVWKGFNSIVSLLISARADVNKIDCDFDSDVMGEAEWVHDQYMLELFSFYYISLFMNSISPLLVASSKGFLSLIKILLKAGADVNLTNCGWFPLVAASQGGHYECVEYLISAGANINQRDKWFNTSVFYACMGNEKNCFRSLIDAGCCINISNKYGETALFNAASLGNPDCVKTLLDSGAHVDSVNDKGDTPLIAAARLNREENIKVLLQYNPDVNKVNDNCKTALMWTMDNRNISCADLLIKKGADVNKPSRFDTTLLMRAAVRGDHDVVKFLLEKKSYVNRVDAFGDTPLINAVYYGRVKCVKLLISAHSNVNYLNNEYFTKEKYSTAFNAALNFVRLECMKILLSAGAFVNYGRFDTNLFFRNLQRSKDRTELVEVLYASGQLIHYKYERLVEVFSPQLQERNLKHLCRKRITRHLIFLNRYSNLYNRIPHIGLPNLLKDYLLYNTSLS